MAHDNFYAFDEEKCKVPVYSKEEINSNYGKLIETFEGTLLNYATGPLSWSTDTDISNAVIEFYADSFGTKVKDAEVTRVGTTYTLEANFVTTSATTNIKVRCYDGIL